MQQSSSLSAQTDFTTDLIVQSGPNPNQQNLIKSAVGRDSPSQDFHPEDLYRIEKRDHRFFSCESFSSPAKRKHLIDIEQTLIKFIEHVMSTNIDEQGIKRLIFLPAGIPGMGKTTIGRFLEQASIRVRLENSGQEIKVVYKRISYDVVFTDLQQNYLQEHPDADFQSVFDIIRGQADDKFNELIKESCQSQVEKKLERPIQTAANQQLNAVDLDPNVNLTNQEKILEILFIDKNNTPDKWETISTFLRKLAIENNQETAQKLIMLVPQQAPFNPTIYKISNAICPQFVYECLFRIFNRKNHCLSHEHKPKAVEVILKYQKFFDNISFDNDSTILQYFDYCLNIEFVNYAEQRISDSMIEALIEGYNQTPENFVPPSHEVIEKILLKLETEIKESESHRIKEMENFNIEIKLMTSQSQKDDEYFH
eukprot:403366501